MGSVIKHKYDCLKQDVRLITGFNELTYYFNLYKAIER